MKRILPLILLSVAGLLPACRTGFEGFRLAETGPGRAPVESHTVFNGYTDHWQDLSRRDFRYGNLYRINAPDDFPFFRPFAKRGSQRMSHLPADAVDQYALHAGPHSMPFSRRVVSINS